jgi:DNA primase
MQDAKEEVRSRLNIEEVIGEYIRLTRAGRNFKGLSPFTGEKTPSFMVSPDKHVWYDFSSNRGGDIFSFIMEMEGLDFRGALELLARRAGVELGEYQGGGQELSRKKQRLHGLLAIAQAYYQQTLLKNPRALNYVIKERKLNKKVIKDFGIGFAPESTKAITDFLTKKGYSLPEIKAAGMSNQRGGDLFRSRIMISLHDPAGQVIGFTGRYIGSETSAPKYLNTPQTLLYDKSRHIFGLHLAKESIRKLDQAVMVEGNLDVIASHQAGIAQVVAAAGTALTDQHLRALKRFTPHISLALDNDKAGLAATERTIPLAEQLDISLKIISLPDGAKDPDELIQASPQKWQLAIDSSRPVVEWVLKEYEARYDITTAEGKRHFSSAALAVIKNLKDPIEKDHYMQVVAHKTNASLQAVEAKLRQAKPDEPKPPLKKTSLSPQESAETSHGDTMLSLAALYPAVRTLLIEVEDEDIPDKKARALFHFLNQHHDTILTDRLPKTLHEVETYVKILLFRAEARYGSWNDLDRYDETAKLIKLIKNDTKLRKKQCLAEELQQAETAADGANVRRLREELNKVIKEIG